MRSSVLCNNIRKYRVSCGLTQSELAVLCGLTKNSISSLERGEFSPSAYTASLLCLALHCDFSDLFYFQ